MKIIFLGTPNFVQPIKENLKKNFTLVESLKEADLAVVAAYGKILTLDELNSPKFGCINIHPSLLPKYRGPSPIQSAILNGDKTTGVTIIKMDQEMDHGPIIYQEEFDLLDTETFESIAEKSFGKANEVLVQIINDFIAGKIIPQEQNHADATFCKMLRKESGYFDIDQPPLQETLDKMIRAYYPWPGVWTKWRVQGTGYRVQEKIVKFLPAHIAMQSVAGGPQYMMQMEGKKAVSKKDFLNGYPDFPLK